jgi:histidine triad (HIT) family protein
MSDIFCQIVAGEVPSEKVWENNDFIAILDIQPNREGVTLVLSKNHYESDFSELPKDVAAGLINACQEVAKLIKKGLGVDRVILVAEGLGVPHLHFKLYPHYQGGEGYLTTETGPQCTPEELKVVGDKIRGGKA